MTQLTVDDLPRPLELGIRRADEAHHLNGIADGGEGIAQLVCQHGQELIFAPVSLLDVPDEPGVVDGDPRTAGQLLNQGELRRAVTPARGAEDKGQRPQRFAARPECGEALN